MKVSHEGISNRATRRDPDWLFGRLLRLDGNTMNSNPLIAALEAIESATLDVPDMALMRSKARALMVGYDIRWANQQYTTVAVEDLVTGELFNPETTARSRTFTIAG